MKDFFKSVFASALGTFLAIAAGGFAMIVLIVSLASSAGNKVCPREVFELVERDEDEMDEDLDEDQMSVMSLKNMLDCIGCGSCARVCPKQCHTHQALPVSI